MTDLTALAARVEAGVGADRPEWHRGWHISRSFMGWWFQHPGFDRENETDWRYGHAKSHEDACDEIDRLLAEDAEWNEAVRILRARAQEPRP